jgi:hypothetical protein
VKTTENKHTQGSAELSGVTLEKPRERRLTPPVGSSGVSLLEVLLDGLLGVLPLSGLLESLGRDGSLQALELESVSGGEQVGVVDSLRKVQRHVQRQAVSKGQEDNVKGCASN